MRGGSSSSISSIHPPIGSVGQAGCKGVGHRTGVGQQGQPQAHQGDGFEAHLPGRSYPPHPFCLHSEVHLLAQPDRVVVFHPGAQATEARQLPLGRGSISAHSCVHRVLQPDDGQAIQVDLPGTSAQGLNRWVIYTAVHYVARLTLSPGQERPSDLYEAIPHRHTNRYPYDTGRQVPAGTLDDLDALNDQADVKVFWFSSPEERKRIGDLTIAATEAFIADEEQSSDSNAWYRHDWDEIQHKRDGITLDASGAPFPAPDGRQDLSGELP